MKKRHLKVLLLFEVQEVPQPPEVYEGWMETDESWFTEGHVLTTLRENGHEVRLGPIHRHPREVIDLVEKAEPDLVWNCVETFHGHRYFESNIVGILELLRVPYTGCGHRCLMICQDKALSKKILKHHRVNVPAFVVSRKRRPARSVHRTVLPALVKPLAEEGSVGIAKDSFAETEEQAVKRARFLHERLEQDVIIERYIEGREIYVGVLGDMRLKVLPPRELKFTKVPVGEPKYASYKAKWDPEYRKRWGIGSTYAEDLPDNVLREMERVAKRVFRNLMMRGYGRIDMRLTPDERLFVMEANPNPEIAMYEDFSEAARKAGISYHELIERIARMGLSARVP